MKSKNEGLKEEDIDTNLNIEDLIVRKVGFLEFY